MRTNHFLILLAGLLLGHLFTSECSAQDTVDYPERGEGIFQLLKRNGIPASQAVLAEFREMNAEKLINGSELRRDVAYSLPVSVNTMTVPILGPDNEKVTIESDELKGVVYYIISGHGGRDPGATGKRNGKYIYEDEYAYDISLRLGRNLIKQGATVYFLTRDDDGIRDDEFLPADHDEKHLGGEYVGSSSSSRVKTRVKKINQLHRKHSGARLERVIELHVDAHAVSKQIDIDFYYNSASGKQLAQTLRRSLEKQYKQVRPDRGYNGRITRKTSWYTLREAIPVTTYIELGNIHHRGDQLRIIQWDNRQLIADWLALGFLEDASLSSK